MALIEAASVIAVDYSPLDNDHQAFIALLNRLDTASSADFRDLFQQLFEHTEQHFAVENQLMLDYGFPAAAEHKGEHSRVLGEFKQFKSRIDKGMLAFGRSFVRERLPQWLQLHVATMDSALVAHIKAAGGAD